MNDKRVTVPAVKAMKRGQRIGMLTAYDFPSAQVVDAAGADIILVGDSLGMVVLGYPDTLSVTVDEMIHHTRAVARGTSHALVVGDMPYLSYHISLEESVNNAGGFKLQGKNADDARRLMDEAIALDQAGCFSIVLECVPAELASLITERVSA